MSTKKFEQLIEYIINDDDQKARELFHEIVVEKSREVYENLMNDEYGDQVDDFIDDVESDEEGMNMDSEDEDMEDMEDMEDYTDVEDMDSEDEDMEDEGEVEELEDRVVDLEDKLDELMAEFDALMSEEEDEDMEDEDMDSEDEDMEDEDMEDEEGKLAESLEAVMVKHQDHAGNKVSPVAQNSGKKIVNQSPAKMDLSTEMGRPAPVAKDMKVNDPKAAAKTAYKK